MVIKASKNGSKFQLRIDLELQEVKQLAKVVLPTLVPLLLFYFH